MKEIYKKPEAEINEFSICEDILTASSETTNNSSLEGANNEASF